jgi:hypothetical protein
MNKKTWDIGNLFAVPLADGSYSLGQVVGREAQVLNSITCAFFQTRVPEHALPSVLGVPPISDLISVQFITKDNLTGRLWKVLGNYPVTLDAKYFPHEDTRARRWVGAKMIGSGIISNFLNAYFGLEAWDQMKDPNYFDKLLIDPKAKPTKLKYGKAT